MTQYEEELFRRRCTDALIKLNIEIAKFDFENENLILVRDCFCDLYENWLERLGTPETIKPEVKAQWLRDLADRIETEESHHEVLKNL